MCSSPDRGRKNRFLLIRIGNLLYGIRYDGGVRLAAGDGWLGIRMYFRLRIVLVEKRSRGSVGSRQHCSQKADCDHTPVVNFDRKPCLLLQYFSLPHKMEPP